MRSAHLCCMIVLAMPDAEDCTKLMQFHMQGSAMLMPPCVAGHAGGALAQNSNSQASGGAIGTKGFTNTGNSNINAQQNKVFPGRKLLTK